MERKTIPFEVKDIDEETGIFEGYAATFSSVPDSYGDIIDPGAFKKTLKESANRVKILWNHIANEPIGKPIEIKEDDRGLWIKGKLSLGVQRAREVLSLMKDGVINEMSIGYDTIVGPMIQGTRHLKEIRLWDTSPVTFAANPEAMILAVKSDLESGTIDKENIRAAIDTLNALLTPADTEPVKATPNVTDTEAADLDMVFSALQNFDAIKAERRIDELLSRR